MLFQRVLSVSHHVSLLPCKTSKFHVAKAVPRSTHKCTSPVIIGPLYIRISEGLSHSLIYMIRRGKARVSIKRLSDKCQNASETVAQRTCIIWLTQLTCKLLDFSCLLGIFALFNSIVDDAIDNIIAPRGIA